LGLEEEEWSAIVLHTSAKYDTFFLKAHLTDKLSV
jgi:hypothetical protein